MNYNEPMFLISAVAQRLGIHPQTLRQYEREGLIEPGRSAGKVRMYSQRDVDKVRLILRFTRELGVNLAGVGVILQLKAQIEHYEELLRAAGMAQNLQPLECVRGGDCASDDSGDDGDDDDGAGGGALMVASTRAVQIYKKRN